jgi:tetraprenyl-beta-curcumene synthase
LKALTAAVVRQLTWGLRAVAHETRIWRRLAVQIPDPAIREDALNAIDHKRGHIDGAALFWTIPRSRSPDLLRLLAAYQIMWDFLDNVSERGAAAGEANGRHLHLALIDALDGRPIHDYYRWHPWHDDGGYLRALVETSRESFRRMPSHPAVRELVTRDARRAGVQAINHDLNPARRAQSLREWVSRELPGEHDATWYELAGAASAGLSIYALLALSAERACDTDVARVYNAYAPWISAVTTMLDSYVDAAEDTANGDHVYVAYYPTPDLVVPGIARLERRALEAMRSLPLADRHRVIVTCMIALHLSRDSARSAALKRSTRKLADAGGSLTRLLVPVLRLWRTVYSQHST